MQGRVLKYSASSSGSCGIAKVDDAGEDVLKKIEFIDKLLVFGLRASTLVERRDEIFNQETNGDDVSDRSKGDWHRGKVAALVIDQGMVCE